MKTTENRGFSASPEAMGRSEGVKQRLEARKPNKINGFVHVFYGTTLFLFQLLVFCLQM